MHITLLELSKFSVQKSIFEFLFGLLKNVFAFFSRNEDKPFENFGDGKVAVPILEVCCVHLSHAM